jgi:hypothetical protein
MQCGPDGWSGPHLFFGFEKRLPRISNDRMVFSEEMLPRLIFAFISPILRRNGAALDDTPFATQLDHRKIWVCSSFSEEHSSHAQLVRE